MGNNSDKKYYSQFDIGNIHEYRESLFLRGSARKLRPRYLDPYVAQRVEVLRTMYEENPPKVIKKWVLPNGATDGRQAILHEEYSEPPVSPFDLPDFENRMPDIEEFYEDYNIEEETRKKMS